MIQKNLTKCLVVSIFFCTFAEHLGKCITGARRMLCTGLLFAIFRIIGDKRFTFEMPKK